MSDHRKAPRSMLSSAEVYKVCSWLQNEHACGHLTPADTYESLAMQAAKVLGFGVSKANMTNAFNAIGIKLPEVPKTTASVVKELQVRVTALEQEMKALKSSLGL